VFSASTGGVAQTVADSLRQLIHEADEPRHRIDLQNNLAYELLESNLEESFQTSSRALVESRKIKYRLGEGWALAYQALYYQYVGEPRRGLDINIQARSIAQTLTDTRLMAFTYLHCGRLFRDIGLLDSTIINYERAEVIQKRAPDFQVLWQIYSSFTRYYLLRNDQAKALEAANRSLEMAKLLKASTLISYSLLDIGDCYRDRFNFEEALSYYAKAIENNPNASWIITDYNESMGGLYWLIGDFDKAHLFYSQVISTYEIFDGRHTLAGSLIRMAQIMGEEGLYDIATEYLFKALKISEEAGYIGFTADAYYEMARINYQASQLSLAMSNIKKAETLFQSINDQLGYGGCQSLYGIVYMLKHNFDSSLYYHNRGMQLRQKAGNKIGISSSMINIGDLYLTFNKRKEALSYLLKGLTYELEIGDRYGVCQYKNKIGSIYLQNGDYQKASQYLNEALTLATNSSSLSWLGITYNNLANLSEAQGDFKQALKLRKQFEEMNDSIYSIGTAQSLASYRTLYDINQKDQQIELLNKDKLIQQDQLRLRNFVLYGTIALAVVLGLLAYLFYHYSTRLRKLNNSVQERSEEIQTQSEELLESNDALVRLNSEISRQREEIKSQAEELKVSNEAIAKINEGLEKMVEERTTALRSAYQELDTFFYRSSHDFRRPLTTLMGLSEVAKLSIKDQNALDLFDKVNITATNLDKMLLKLQSISDVGSHQMVYKEVMLRQIIENELNTKQDVIRIKEIRVSVDVKLTAPFISYPVLVKIIIENLIENAIDFAVPVSPTLAVRAMNKEENIIIEVADNGEGIREENRNQVFEMFFRGSERSTGNGLGLYIAKKAADRMFGQISFNNNSTGGTTFRVVIPRQEMQS
jgi:signal transduction histidine kinase